MADPTTEVLIPVKKFTEAKERLSPHLDAAQRAELARLMAAQVIEAARPFGVSVVCDSEDVATFADKLGARVIWCPRRGLNNAVRDGVRALAAEGVDRVVVSHSDLPLARDFSELVDFPGVLLVPDRHGKGTNVASVSTKVDFRWSYGPGSFERHRAEALRLGLALGLRRIPELTWDIDTPADLAPPHPRGLPDPLAELLALTPTA